MNSVCLLVDLDETGLQDTWQDEVYKHDLFLEVNYCNREDVYPMLTSGNVVSMVVFAQEPDVEVFNILELFKKHVGGIPSFQAIVCDKPSPIYLTQVFEWGIEKFFTQESWAPLTASLTKEVESLADDGESPEAKIIQLNRSILSGDQTQIAESEELVNECAEYDFLAAYSKGTALQAVGRFNEAIDAFRTSQEMNNLFRPSISGIGENLLVLGKVDEAIEVFQELEKVNKRSVDRKANLASAYMEKGDFEKAKAYLKEAHRLNPKHPRIAETKAQFLITQGRIGEAFKLMDQLHDVGPFFAAKLNEMGIRLSQKGKGKSALALYKKAHKIVKAELRYKISLNAALACYRMEDFKLSMKYLLRCEKEYGKKFEKVDKIKLAIQKAMKKPSPTKAAG
ncbi:tetratricopeptide repeat protein [Pseudobacteriovorax antillogorgiicola]|uniref:Flp pilus assembly protein TadD, contains TPR repeats n=2 Tax=Pseudobacteriovorax antillogorgiicola TaxID=1513793 RepID=A0A1Y6CH74_9BACT|nr:tetratricopeptide repeat protein [Pseudobacteriovorax antillogorgiicola]TCS48695.1 Flp pilus assembly protein TadD [Pseudobacteriovorax antillogorgiicola]SMF54767.1 Flp pilus assembly protein TadD, contains TPR repeats [Pseudobacteriovorax antillogorgiicola]